MARRHELPPSGDGVPSGRGAVFISDPRIPVDRQLWNALCSIGMLRTGEAAGLRFDAIVADKKPLVLMDVFTSYDDGSTKTDEERWTPIHPVLAAMLAEWRLTHWPAIFGRTPTPNDLVCPVVPKESNWANRLRPLAGCGTATTRGSGPRRIARYLGPGTAGSTTFAAQGSLWRGAMVRFGKP